MALLVLSLCRSGFGRKGMAKDGLLAAGRKGIAKDGLLAAATEMAAEEG